MEVRNVISAITLVIFISTVGSVPSSAQTQPQPRTPAVDRQQTPSQQPAKLPVSRAATTAVDEQLGTLDARSRRALSLQVALDRAGFSPGAIDATLGNNTKRAMRAFQESKGLTPTGELDERTIASLGDVFHNPVASYAISANDVEQPFVGEIPADMMEKSKLPSLSYSSVAELLSERFHASSKLLQRLNPQAKFERGEVIVVPNVELFFAPGLVASTAQKTTQPGQQPADATRAVGSANTTPDAARAGATRPMAITAGNVVTVTDKDKSLIVQNAAGETIFYAPVTVGSQNDPLPVGEWKVNGVSRNPSFNYNPDLFWDADPAHAKAKIPAGPNNPVGVVWIDLSKEHYGIHGTPEPSRIGYTESHGCIRLTNWDAMRLTSLVAPGTKVILR